MCRSLAWPEGACERRIEAPISGSRMLSHCPMPTKADSSLCPGPRVPHRYGGLTLGPGRGEWLRSSSRALRRSVMVVDACKTSAPASRPRSEISNAASGCTMPRVSRRPRVAPSCSNRASCDRRRRSPPWEGGRLPELPRPLPPDREASGRADSLPAPSHCAEGPPSLPPSRGFWWSAAASARYDDADDSDFTSSSLPTLTAGGGSSLSPPPAGGAASLGLRSCPSLASVMALSRAVPSPVPSCAPAGSAASP